MSPGAFALANQLSLTSKELVRCILGRRRTISILQSSAARLDDGRNCFGPTLTGVCLHYEHALGGCKCTGGFLVALVIGIVAIIAVFVEIPIISEYAFWVLTGAFLLTASTRHR